MTATVRLLATTNPGRVYTNGRTVNGTTVQLGPIEVTERKTSDAVATVEARMDAFLTAANHGYGPVIVTRGGYTSVSALILTSEGPAWHETTVTPDGKQSGTTTSSYDGRDRQSARVRMSLAQRVADWTDNAQVLGLAEWVGGDGARVFLDYAGFQRAFIVAGHKDVPGDDRWQWAQDHRAEYVPTA